MSQRVRLIVDVLVNDEALLRAFADERSRASWQEPVRTFHGDALGGAVYEALVASNANPSPDLYGIEIDGHHYAIVDDDGRLIEELQARDGAARGREQALATTAVKPHPRARISPLAERLAGAY